MNETKEYQRPVTHKGTVTIPIEIRRLLGVKPRGMVTFRIVEGKRVELSPPSMTLKDTFGSVKSKQHPLNFKELRDSAIDEQVRKTLKKMKGR